MAQSLNAPEAGTAKPAGQGHNKPPLTREEKAALLSHHIGELRRLEAAVEVVRAPFKAAQEAVTKQFNLAKGELGKNYSRKYLANLMEDFGERLRNVAATEEQRFQDRLALGLPVFGVQQDLFGGAKTETERDGIAAEADGYMAGRRGDEPAVPAEFSIFAAGWMKGYHKGQDETAKQVALAMEVKAARSAPAVEPKADEEPEVDIEAAARKLKGRGFTKRSAPANAIPAE